MKTLFGMIYFTLALDCVMAHTGHSVITSPSKLNHDAQAMIRLKGREPSRCLKSLSDRTVADICDASDSNQWFTFEHITTSVLKSYKNRYYLKSLDDPEQCISSGALRTKKKYFLSRANCLAAGNDAIRTGPNLVYSKSGNDIEIFFLGFKVISTGNKLTRYYLHQPNPNSWTIKNRLNRSSLRWEIVWKHQTPQANAIGRSRLGSITSAKQASLDLLKNKNEALACSPPDVEEGTTYVPVKTSYNHSENIFIGIGSFPEPIVSRTCLAGAWSVDLTVLPNDVHKF